MNTPNLPNEVEAALAAGAALAISVSGGKDSHAMLSSVTRLFKARGYTGQLFAIHADLGRAEWRETHQHVQDVCDLYGVPLVVVQHAKGDLVDRIQRRFNDLEGTGKPFWPSSAARYCTSDLKRNPINKHLRKYTHIISAEGIRACESRARAKKPCWSPRKAINTQTRVALTWNPILDWTDADVWAEIGTSLEDLERRRGLYTLGHEAKALQGWVAHPAYVYGNQRLSCALCVLASRGDLENGVRHNLALAETYMAMEAKSGFTFQPHLSLTVIHQTMQQANGHSTG